MSQPLTTRELLIKAHDTIAQRLVYAKVDVLYFEALVEKAEDNTQDKVSQIANRKDAANRVEKDTIYLDCIDQLLEQNQGE